MQDELDAPLGAKDQKPGLKQKLVGATMALPGLIVARVQPLATKRTLFRVLNFSILSMISFFVVASIWVIVVDDPEGGQPKVRSEITHALEKNDFANQLRLSSAEQETRDTNTADAQNIENQTVPQGFEIIEVPDDVAVDDDQDSLSYSVADLLEETQHGAVPRVNNQGLRAFDRYARASAGSAGLGDAPRIAIVVTGLGLSRQGTRQAIRDLPADVTLAFAPYGDSLENSARLARESGHEILLQIPLEPYDYPNSDPGPQTLLTGASPRSNIERLHWLMSRFGAYVGVINYMGARFTASENDFTPIMEELSLRGIGYIDDGSSTRSLADKVAQNNKVPFAQIDANLDIQPTRPKIIAQLDALEKIAEQKGQAIGQISALPVSIQAVTEWANGLQDKNIVLVPISALARR